MSVSKKNSPLLLENWCPRKLKPLVSYRPFSSHCQKSNMAPGMGRHALSMTRPVKRMRGAFIFVSTRFTRSGDWGLKKGPSNWEGVCFSQTGRTNCCANDFRLVKIAGVIKPKEMTSRVQRCKILRREIIIFRNIFSVS